MKERLDVLLVNRGYYPSREKAKTSIMAGAVFVDGQRFAKAGSLVDEGANITIKEDVCPYVSRGGLKLEKSIKTFPIELRGKYCMDIGASTGGFTDCMLKNGAKKVYAIDVGYGQLDYKLRTDDRVVNMEKCNVRYLDTSLIEEPIDFISIDVSFISLKLIFPVAKQVISETGEIICLIKPQFEAGREQVGKNGIVKDEKVHVQVIEQVVEYARENDFTPCGLTFSPIKGAKGNIEYLMYLKYKQAQNDDIDAERVVKESHAQNDDIDAEKVVKVVKESHNQL